MEPVSPEDHRAARGDARVVEAAAAIYQPLLVSRRQVAGRVLPTSFRPSIIPASIEQIAPLKVAQTGMGTVIRLYESGGRRTRVILSGHRCPVFPSRPAVYSARRIDGRNLVPYLRSPLVLCVDVSWLARVEYLQARNWATISKLAMESTGASARSCKRRQD